eukprot:Em0008g1202a
MVFLSEAHSRSTGVLNAAPHVTPKAGDFKQRVFPSVQGGKSLKMLKSRLDRINAGVGMQTDAAHGTVKVEKDRRLADIKAQQRAEIYALNKLIQNETFQQPWLAVEKLYLEIFMSFQQSPSLHVAAQDNKTEHIFDDSHEDRRLGLDTVSDADFVVSLELLLNILLSTSARFDDTDQGETEHCLCRDDKEITDPILWNILSSRFQLHGGPDCAMSKIVDDITLLSRRSPLSRWSGIMDTPACTEARNVVGAASPNSNDTRRPRRPLLVTDERQCFLVMDDDDFEQTPVDTLIADDDQLEVWTTFDPLVAGVRDFERSNAEWEHVEPNAATEHEQLVAYMRQPPVKELGLDAQDYKCAGCGCPLGIIFGEANVCHFDGKSYCGQCHHGNQAIIPGRVLFNWEFQKYSVCNKCHKFLRHVKSMPALDLSIINQSLYNYVSVLEEAHKLKVQLKELTPYLVSCKKRQDAIVGRSKRCPKFLYENEHIFSINELVRIHRGTLVKSLSKAVKEGIRHVLQCSSCSSKGCICECCHSPKSIFSFDIQKIYKCPRCTTLSHLSCCSRRCPVCQT